MGWFSQELIYWLDASVTDNGDYRHVRLDEDPEWRDEGLEALRDLVDRAHEDARQRLDALAGVNLHPLGHAAAPGGVKYPDSLGTSTLQGYLGEIFAGVFAENYKPHNREWELPAFLFRVHLAAFQALERRRQLGGPAQATPGRTGDDCAVFLRDENGVIVEWLMCEAKCSHDHSSTLIKAGHEQLNVALTAPVDVLQLVEILQDSNDPDAADWIDALRLLLQDSLGPNAPDRLDLLMYVCGRSPSNKPTWIPTDASHAAYDDERPLEAVEVHLPEFDEVLSAAYPDHTIAR